MIQIENLRVERDGNTICAVEKLHASAGERVAVLGPNGSGKTTLLRVLAGLEERFAGRCTVEARAAERTYLHQRPYLFRGSVASNVAYGISRRKSASARREEAKHLLERLGIGNLAERDAASLSGGERRRVALARALAVRPQLLLLDEPFAELDDEAAAIVAATLNELESTIVIATPTPLPKLLAARCDLIFEMGHR